MPNTHIDLDRSKAVANIMAQVVADAIALKASAAQATGLINSITGGGATPANIETAGYGVSAGQGAALYSLIHDVIYLNTNAMTDVSLATGNNG